MALTKLIFPPFLSNEAYKTRQVSFQPMTRDIDHNSAESSLKDRSNQNEVDELLGVAGSTITGFQIDGIIVLPLPGEISDSQSHSWNEEEGILSKGLDGIMKKVTSFLQNSDLKGDNALGSLLENRDYATSYAFHKAGLRKPLTDPGMFQSYKGSNPRSFSMSFSLIPNSAEEAELIRQIIIAFKKYSSPNIGLNNTTMIAPYYWHVTFENPAINSMFRMDCVVITNVSVDYGEGDMQLFVDGFPKMVKLTLSMQEARLTYAENYEDLGFGDSRNGASAATPKIDRDINAVKEAVKQTVKNFATASQSASNGIYASNLMKFGPH